MKDGPITNPEQYNLKWPDWIDDVVDMMTEEQDSEVENVVNKFVFSNKTREQMLGNIDDPVVKIVFNVVAIDLERQVRDHYPARIRNSREYQEWRACVFERDHYTCQNCGQVGGTINAHHIKSFKDYPDLRLEVNNGITLCLKCHKLAHGKKAIKCR